MYKLLLILKYLRKRRIAWVSLIAVMLCTAMVLVVISVMGGWLRMFKSSFQGLSGDIVVRGDSRVGFPHYEEMIRRLEASGEVVAAVPQIETFGLVNIDNRIRDGVRVIGLPIEKIGRVNGFWDSLYLKNPEISPEVPLAEWKASVEEEAEAIIADIEAEVAAGRVKKESAEREKEILRAQVEASVAIVEEWAQRVGPDAEPNFELPFDPNYYRLKMNPDGSRPEGAPDPAGYPGMIVGVGLVGQQKDDEGEMDRWYQMEPTNPHWASVLTLELDPDNTNVDLASDKGERTYWIVDTSRTGVFQTDDQTVYVPFDLLQADLGMDEQPEYGFDPETFEPTDEVVGMSPARAGELHIKLEEGVDLMAGRNAVRRIVDEVRRELGSDPRYPVSVETWEERYGDFLAAVEKEKALVTVLFSFISVVAIFLIFCIFYMIVQEKTKDIGIVKSVGATNAGIASIFLGYGAAIGIVGGGLGLLMGGLIVFYINEIHDLMGVVLGVQIWNASTYMFDKIPNTINPREAAVIFAVAVASSIIGAVVPAWRAARLHPVEALRFE